MYYVSVLLNKCASTSEELNFQKTQFSQNRVHRHIHNYFDVQKHSLCIYRGYFEFTVANADMATAYVSVYVTSIWLLNIVLLYDFCAVAGDSQKLTMLCLSATSSPK